MGVRAVIGSEYGPTVCRLLSEARESVCVACYRIAVRGRAAATQSLPLVRRLCQARARGVDCRVLVNSVFPVPGGFAQNVEGVALLLRAGIPVRSPYPAQVLHAKMVLVDRRVAVVGSHNWSAPSLTTNFEVSILLDDPEAVARLCQAFDTAWNRGLPCRVGGDPGPKAHGRPADR